MVVPITSQLLYTLYTKSMNSATAMKKLKTLVAVLRAMGTTSLYLSGSTARSQAKPSSDLDLFIEYDRRRVVSLCNLSGIKLLLEDKLGTPVDLTMRDSLHPLLRNDIESAPTRNDRSSSPSPCPGSRIRGAEK